MIREYLLGGLRVAVLIGSVLMLIGLTALKLGWM